MRAMCIQIIEEAGPISDKNSRNWGGSRAQRKLLQRSDTTVYSHKPTHREILTSSNSSDMLINAYTKAHSVLLLPPMCACLSMRVLV